ncbi:beta-lactamase-like protein [Leucosporidium creatinivorum]|uniref:Beta-lactamase-like protein n=1 Tax=Leucosporidium creatinivorum TaxID=106004 RepID=A0A1Y2D8I8_9BASI|nr:beta-lactamase-like protein [Leucosporidium creatinivorum]
MDLLSHSQDTAALDKPLRLVVLGSGGSAAVPDIACVTNPRGLGCACCMAAMTKEGKHNVRGNTGALLIVPQQDGSERNILIDCGKTFREQALRIFPKKRLRRIDACILTHHHADAIDGLDDLRSWTYQAAVEKSIPIYCTRTTYQNVAEGFPYMISKKAASGSGAVPSFQWHVFDETEPLWIAGIRITPLPVHHGVYFTSPPSPLISMGFLINSTLMYCSDVSFIPESTWATIAREVTLPSSTGTYSTSYPPLPRLCALIIDSSSLRLSKSHFGLPQALGTARRLGALKTYLTDLPHMTSHECWLHFCEDYGKGREPDKEVPWSSGGGGRRKEVWRKWEEGEQQGPYAHVYGEFDPVDEDFEVFTEKALEAIEEWDGGVLAGRRPWVRPLADGLTISWTEGESVDISEERVWDDLYH